MPWTTPRSRPSSAVRIGGQCSPFGEPTTRQRYLALESGRWWSGGVSSSRRLNGSAQLGGVTPQPNAAKRGRHEPRGGRRDRHGGQVRGRRRSGRGPPTDRPRPVHRIQPQRRRNRAGVATRARRSRRLDRHDRPSYHRPEVCDGVLRASDPPTPSCGIRIGRAPFRHPLHRRHRPGSGLGLLPGEAASGASRAKRARFR